MPCLSTGEPDLKSERPEVTRFPRASSVLRRTGAPTTKLRCAKGILRRSEVTATTRMVHSNSSISNDILARYAADAACEVAGVTGLVDRHLPGRRGVRVVQQNGDVRVELHLALAWGASMPDVGRAVQRRVRDYLTRMADLDDVGVDVVVADVAEVD
jgi:uncharacterized alkaline shock family protein YloU